MYICILYNNLKERKKLILFYAEKREKSDIFLSEEKLRKGIRISLVQYVIILMLNLLIESLLEGKKTFVCCIKSEVKIMLIN